MGVGAMGGRHLIDQLLFATDLDREAFECAPWDDWPGLCRDRLLAVIEKVFDEFSPGGDTVHRLDQLEVDLGDLSATASVEEVEAGLAEALRRQLQECLRPGGAAGAVRPVVVRESVAALEQLEFYLEHGLLPWNADASGAYDLEGNLRRQAGRHGARLGPWLLKTDRALERTIRQLPDGALAQVLSALAPRGGEAAFTGWLARLQEQAAKAPRSEARYRTWRSAFRSALGKRGELRQAAATHPEMGPGAVQGVGLLHGGGKSGVAVRGDDKPAAAAVPAPAEPPVPGASRASARPGATAGLPGETAAAAGVRDSGGGCSGEPGSIPSPANGVTGHAFLPCPQASDEQVPGAAPVLSAPPGDLPSSPVAARRHEAGSHPMAAASEGRVEGEAAESSGVAVGIPSELEGLPGHAETMQGQEVLADDASFRGGRLAKQARPETSLPDLGRTVGSISSAANPVGLSTEAVPTPSSSQLAGGPEGVLPGRTESVGDGVDPGQGSGNSRSPDLLAQEAAWFEASAGTDGLPPGQGIPAAGKANPVIPKEPVPPPGHPSVDPHGYWASGQSPESGGGLAGPPEEAVEDEEQLRVQVLARVQGVFAEAVLRHAARAVHPGRYYRRLLTALAGQEPVDLEALAAESGNPAPAARSAGAAAKAASRPPIPGASPSVAVVGSSEGFPGASGRASTSDARLPVPGNGRKNSPLLSAPASAESAQAAGLPPFPDSGTRGGQAVVAGSDVTPRDAVPAPTGEPPLSPSSRSGPGTMNDTGSVPAGTKGLAGNTVPAVEPGLPSASASVPVQNIPASGKANPGIPMEAIQPPGNSSVDPHGYWASGQSQEPGSGVGAPPEGPVEGEEELRAQVLARVDGVFAEAVLRHASRAVHPGRYYRRLLTALARQESVDLEALAAGNGKPDSRPSSAAPPAGAAGESDPGSDGTRAANAVSRISIPGESAQAAGQPSFPDSRDASGQAVAAAAGPDVTPRDAVSGPTGPGGLGPLAGRLVAAAPTGELPLSTFSAPAPGAMGDGGSVSAGTRGGGGNTAPAVQSALPSTSASLPVQGILAAGEADSGMPKEAAPEAPPADAIRSPLGPPPVDPHGYWASGQSPKPEDGPGMPPEGRVEDAEELRVQVLARVEGVFAEAVLRHAGRAAHPGRYYRRLLAALAGQKSVDLDALAAQSSTPDSSPSSAARPAGAAGEADSGTNGVGAGDAASRTSIPGAPSADAIQSPAGHSPVDPRGYWASGQFSEPGSGPGLPPEGVVADEEQLRAQVLAQVEGVFAEAVLRHAGRAAHPGRYYRRLLTALAGQEPVDLEALAAESGSPDSPPAPAVRLDGAAAQADPKMPAAAPSSPGAAGAGTALAGLPSRAWVEQSLAAGWNALGLVIAPLLAQPEAVARMAEAWPDELLARLLAHLRGEDFARLQPYADAMTAACVREGEAARRRQHWQYLAAVLFPAVRFTSAAPFVNGYADFLASFSSGGGDFRSDLCARLPEEPEQRVLSQHIRFWLLNTGSAPRPAAPPAAAEAARLLPGGGLLVANAGQVLASPYLPRLFDMLGLLKKGRFIGEEEARRACHLLQFMVDAREEAPEYQLVLNKLLCGLDIRHPLEAGISVSEAERSAIEGMLKAIIAHWGALGNTSVAGLRETFLQRPGALSFKDDAWQLKVEKKTVDVLMDRMPWGFSIIRHAWMKQAVMVEWR